MSPSYVDVYFPRRAIAEAELALLPFHHLPSTSHRIDNKGTRSSCTTTHDPRRAERGSSCPPIAATWPARWDVVASSPSNATFHARYHPLDEIESFVRELAAAYPQQVAIVPLGHSGEGREMFALEISSAAVGASAAGARRRSHDQNSQVVLDGKGKESGAGNPRCGFLITGAQHAREVSCPLVPKKKTRFTCFTSGLPLLPHCTSHTPSWLTHRRSFLSPIYLNEMYV